MTLSNEWIMTSKAEGLISMIFEREGLAVVFYGWPVIRMKKKTSAMTFLAKFIFRLYFIKLTRRYSSFILLKLSCDVLKNWLFTFKIIVYFADWTVHKRVTDYSGRSGSFRLPWYLNWQSLASFRVVSWPFQPYSSSSLSSAFFEFELLLFPEDFY